MLLQNQSPEWVHIERHTDIYIGRQTGREEERKRGVEEEREEERKTTNYHLDTNM